MSEHIAVMRGVGYGRWGMHKPGLYFESWLPDGSATLHLLFGGDASKLMAEGGVASGDVTRLEGRRCRVEIDGYTTKFKGLAPVN